MKTNHVPLSKAPLQLAQESFLIAKESEGLSVNTLDVYRRMTDKFISYLQTQQITSLDRITPATVRGYFVQLSQMGYTQHTIHDHARPVKTMLRFWNFDGMMAQDVMQRVKMPATDKTVQPAFSTAEIKSLLHDGCKTPRDTAVISFLLDTGCRASELCALTIGDVDIKNGSVVIEHGKGDKRRVTYMGSKCKRAVLKYLMGRNEYDDSDPLFPSQTGEHLTASGLFQWLERIGDRATIQDCSPHKFRRTMAINCLRSGMSIFMLAKLLGHADISVLRQYLDISTNDLQDAAKQYGALDHMKI